MANLWDTVIGAESGGQNVVNPTPTSSGNAAGYYQITSGTWADFAPSAGVNLAQYPTADTAPLATQTQVANTIPLSRWASSTVAAVQNAFGGNVDPSQTLGAVGAALGQSGGPTIATAQGGGSTGSAAPPGSTAAAGTAPGSPAGCSGLGSLFSWACWGTIAADAGMVFLGLAMIVVGVSAGIHQSPMTVVSLGRRGGS